MRRIAAAVTSRRRDVRSVFIRRLRSGHGTGGCAREVAGWAVRGPARAGTLAPNRRDATPRGAGCEGPRSSSRRGVRCPRCRSCTGTAAGRLRTALPTPAIRSIACWWCRPGSSGGCWWLTLMRWPATRLRSWVADGRLGRMVQPCQRVAGRGDPRVLVVAEPRRAGAREAGELAHRQPGRCAQSPDVRRPPRPPLVDDVTSSVLDHGAHRRIDAGLLVPSGDGPDGSRDAAPGSTPDLCGQQTPVGQRPPVDHGLDRFEGPRGHWRVPVDDHVAEPRWGRRTHA